MIRMKKILAISGSLRKDSFNTKLVHSLQGIVGDTAEITIAEIGNLPLFNQDLEATFPSEVQALKDTILASDAIIFSTPEYNRSIPGVLKNAIDWASRPYGQNAFAGKPVLIIGTTIGTVGTALAQSHLKEILLYLDMKVLGQPEIYISTVQDKVNKDTGMFDEDTIKHIQVGIDKLLAM